MKEFYENMSPPKFIRKMEEIKNNLSSNDGAHCERSIQYRAEIMFRIATDSMSVTVMSKRLSFFDQLSAFGKNWFSIKRTYEKHVKY